MNPEEQLKIISDDLAVRCGSKCELCESDNELSVVQVPPVDQPDTDRCVMACDTCQQQLASQSELNPKHWHCLQQSMWSEVPAVKVISWRMLNRLAEHVWAQELLDQIYLDEETLAWAKQGLVSSSDEGPATIDSNGTVLVDGDTVQIIKDLDVKGTGFVAKRGTMVKNIRLTSNPEHVEGRVNKTAIVLKTVFLKKSN